MKLIYHDEKITGNKKISRFSEILGEIGKSPLVDIVAPYVSPDILNWHFLGCKMRLISDFDECFRVLTKNKAKKFEKMIMKAPEQFRHIAGIHAKVFIGENAALVGSANLTQMGLCKRREMAVLFDEPKIISGLKDWFDELWNQGTEVSLNIINEIINRVPIYREKPKRYFESKASSFKFRLIPKQKDLQKIETEEETIERLKDRIRKAPSRKWIEGYFDLAKIILDFAELENEDQRLVMSIPKYSANPNLPITINQRYVLDVVLKKQKAQIRLMIHPDDYKLIEEKKHVTNSRFKRFSVTNEEPEKVPYYFTFSDPQDVLRSDLILSSWKKIVIYELNRHNKSGYRKYHQSIHYRLATDLEFRKEFLDNIFSEIKE